MNGQGRPDGALEAIYVAALCVCEGLFLAQPPLRVKESCTAAAGFANSAAHLSFGRLAGLGTSGWRGFLSAEGSKAASNYRQKMLLWRR
jgi:hypothetical protein